MIPNPGSDEAIKMGCTCPVLDNAHGNGARGDPNFWISEDCPIHGKYTNVNKNVKIGDPDEVCVSCVKRTRCTHQYRIIRNDTWVCLFKEEKDVH